MACNFFKGGVHAGLKLIGKYGGKYSRKIRWGPEKRSLA
jgi:hypothetical protein